MSNLKFTNRKLVVAFSPAFMTQTAFGTAIANANLTARHPQTTPAFHSIVPFREETRDCSGMYVIIEEITGKIAKFTFAFQATAKMAAGWFAYLQGLAAAPTGSPANESQTINLGGATGGTATFGLDYEGKTGVSSSVATTGALTAAQVQAALEANDAIRAGNVSVTGAAGGPFTVAFINRLAKANIPLLTKTDSSSGGTGVVITAAVNGANNLHSISRSTSDAPVLFSLIEGFENETGGTKKYKDLVMDTYSAAITRRGKLVVTVTAYGNPIPEILSGYSMPACNNVPPISAKDCRLKIGSTYVTGDLREITFTESNNIDVSADALLFDDVTPDQLKSGDPTSSFNFLVLGSPTAAMYAAAEDENNAFAAFELDLGQPGERTTIFAPNTQYRLDDNLIEFVGSRNVSAFRIIARPSPDGSNVVTRAEHNGAFTGTFLLSA